MLAAVLVLLLAWTPQAEEIPGFEFGQAEWDREQGVMRASGGVVVTYRDIRLETDSIVYNEVTGDLDAPSPVRFERGDEVLEAASAAFNLRTRAGVLKEARGHIGPGFYISGQEIHRLEDGRYEVVNGTVTTCEGECPGWFFSVARATVDPGKNVSSRNTYFRFANVPVFYFPYVTAPATERARGTGFLIPSTSTSTSKGRSIRQAFYWAIDRSADATFTGEYFSKRGMSGAVNFRAVPNAASRIEVGAFFAADRQGFGGQSVRVLSDAAPRENLRAVVDANLVSSLEFRQIYEEGFNQISSPLEHSIAFVTSNRPQASLNFLYNRSVVLFPGLPSVVLRKLPEVELSIPSRRIAAETPVYFSMDAAVTGYSRRDASIDTPGFIQRLDIYPVLEIPLVRTAVFEWSHRLALRNTFYSHSQPLDAEPQAFNRLAADYSTAFSGPRLQRDFGSWRHIVEHGVEYRYIAGANRLQQTILLDEVDLFTNTNEIEYSITNRFMAGHEFLRWRLAQKMYFDPSLGGSVIPGIRNVADPLMDLTGFAFADGERRFSPLVSTIRIATTPQTSTDIQVDYDTQRGEFSAAGITGGASVGYFNSNITYFFTKRSDIQDPRNQIRASVGYGNNLKPGISANLGFAYDVQRSLFQGSVAQIGYNADCYGVSMEFVQYDIGERRETSIRFALSLKDLGTIGTDMIRYPGRLF